MGRIPQILALGGGGFSMEAGNPLVDDFALEITGCDRPRVCFVPTASGDADHYVVRFYRRFAAVADCSHLSLFRRDKGAGAVEGDIERHLLAQDLIYVGGGSVLSLLGTWRAHGVDAMLRRAWRRGVVLCGLSAGSLCWFAEAITAFHGPPQVVRGLGILPFSNCVHYDGEPSRREAFTAAIAAGELRGGYAVEDGTALHFVGRELAEVVSSRERASAYFVSADGEQALPLRCLAARALAAA
ncbi:MAG: peptidase E [Actinobacteria bacterium]|nr:MAG: peptidase E [Actinomycetota bacterium]